MAGTVVLTKHQAPPRAGGVGSDGIGRITITATADAADGSFPATTLASLGLNISGTLLVLGTNPGTTAPTDNVDITLIDGDGLDRLGGAGVDRDTSLSERAVLSSSPFVVAGETLTLTISGNSVNSAVVVINLDYTLGAVRSAPSERGSRHVVVTIANGASLSDAIDLSSRAIVGIQIASGWTAAAMTFSASADGVTYADLYDDGGTEVAIASASVPTAAARFITNATILEKLASARFLKIRSGTTGTPVNQGAARSILVSLKA